MGGRSRRGRLGRLWRLRDYEITRVDTSTNGSISQSPNLSISQSQQLLSPPTAWLITDILADNVARMPAFGANSVLKLPFPAAVKTGTTTDWRDNWTVGYSTARIVGVWVGNADNAPMLDVSGVDGAGPIWHDLMLLAHPTAPAGFVRPEGLVEMEICAPSGLLPTPECPRTRWEWFSAGTQPTQPDNQFQRIVLDAPRDCPRPQPHPETARPAASSGCCRRSTMTGW
jgi:membrane carboxypeptidase/penicillin-binding protein PbpC